jgi:hypothetical protein
MPRKSLRVRASAVEVSALVSPLAIVVVTGTALGAAPGPEGGGALPQEAVSNAKDASTVMRRLLELTLTA